jgi:hypothetical protein
MLAGRLPEVELTLLRNDIDLVGDGQPLRVPVSRHGHPELWPARALVKLRPKIRQTIALGIFVFKYDRPL